MAYVDSITVRVRVRARGSLYGEGTPVLDEHVAGVSWHGSFSLDDLDSVLQTTVFDLADQPTAYRVSLSTTSVEQGAGAGYGEVIIDLLEGQGGAAGAAWSVLATLVAKALLDWLKENGKGDEGPP